MRLFVCSARDAASVNIRDALQEAEAWSEVSSFQGSPVMQLGDLLMLTTEDLHIYADGIDEAAEAAIGCTIDEVVFLSRHRAASGKPSLTVHPIGNWGKADFGGRAGTLVPPSPHVMTSLLRQMKEEAAGLGYEVVFEVTHHGPFLSRPTLFIEIGSDESTWGRKDAAAALARSLLGMRVREFPVAIGIGGGHYAPRFTEVALSRQISFGHMLPGYAMDLSDPDGLSGRIAAALKVSGAKLAYVHRKSMKRSEASMVAALVRELGAEPVDSSDLKGLI